MRKIEIFTKKRIKLICSWFNIMIFLLCFSAFSFCFVAGYFSFDSFLEENSVYITKIVNNYVPTKDLLAVAISKKESGSLPDSEIEFLNLYGVFRQEKITFASGYNLTKECSIAIPEINENINFSAGYLGPTTGSYEYKGHYKDSNYPVEFMFPCKRYDDVSMQTAIIGKANADLILENRGFTKENLGYTPDQYYELIATKLDIIIEEQKYTFVIQDIFYDDTYYVNGIKNTVGDFFFTSYYFPGAIKKQNAYFMCKYPYQNEFFMKHINSLYTEKNIYDVKCITNTISKDFNEEKALSFYYGEENNFSTQVVVFILLSSIVLIGSFVIIFFKKDYSLQTLFVNIVSSFLPFIAFKIIYLISGNVRMFSAFGANLHSIFLSTFIIISIILFFIKRRITFNQNKQRDIKYELDV